jgi:hypothetical protein
MPVPRGGTRRVSSDGMAHAASTWKLNIIPTWLCSANGRCVESRSIFG